MDHREHKVASLGDIQGRDEISTLVFLNTSLPNMKL